jgi:hypothetical protein
MFSIFMLDIVFDMHGNRGSDNPFFKKVYRQGRSNNPVNKEKQERFLFEGM